MKRICLKIELTNGEAIVVDDSIIESSGHFILDEDTLEEVMSLTQDEDFENRYEILKTLNQTPTNSN